MDPKAVRRHERTIFACLEDPDISIRRRAIELAFTLINNEKDVGLVDKLLNLLSRGKIDNEFKSALASKVSVAADRFAPNKRWHIDTILRVLKLAGNYVKEQIMSSFIRLIATSPSEQDYCVRELYAAMVQAKDGKSPRNGNGGVVLGEGSSTPAFTEGLTLASSWVLGEYGHRLLESGVSGHEIIALLECVLEHSYNSQTTNEYATNALMKLSTRLPSQEGQHNNTADIKRILALHARSLDVEIQQRTTEYVNMFKQPDEVRFGVFEAMPMPEIRDENRVLGEKMVKAKPARKKNQEMELLELLSDDGPALGGGGMDTTGGGGGNLHLLADILGDTSPSAATTQAGGRQQSSVSDILGLFPGATSSPAPTTTTTTTSPSPAGGLGGLLDVMGGTSSPAAITAAATTPSTTPAAITVYTKNSLEISLQLQRPADGAVYIRARLANTSFTETLSELQLQAAAPRGQKLELKEISTTTIHPAGDAQLQMRLSGSNGVSFFRFFFFLSTLSKGRRKKKKKGGFTNG